MPIGITFDETMTGGFSLDVTDPEAGARLGNKAGTTLAMHATVTIPDLDAFTADSKHPGRLKGTIDFPPRRNRSRSQACRADDRAPVSILALIAGTPRPGRASHSRQPMTHNGP